MSSGLPRRSRGMFGGFLPDEDVATPLAPSRRPPAVWGEVTVEEGELLVRLRGWRAVLAMKKTLSLPVSTIVRAEVDPQPRLHVRAKLRKRAGRSGLFRLGTYHSLDGWSFWAIGLGRNAVVVETDGARYRFVVVEVASPEATAATLRQAAGLEG